MQNFHPNKNPSAFTKEHGMIRMSPGGHPRTAPFPLTTGRRGNSAPKRCKERFPPGEFGEEDQQNSQPTETKSTKTSKQAKEKQPIHPKWHDWNPKVYFFKSMSFVFFQNSGALRKSEAKLAIHQLQRWRRWQTTNETQRFRPGGSKGGSGNLKMQGGPRIHQL